MILITLEGGLVTSVTSDDPAMIGQQVIVNDYDTDGVDDAVTNDEGVDCCPHLVTIDVISPRWVAHIKHLAEVREAAGPEGENDR